MVPLNTTSGPHLSLQSVCLEPSSSSQSLPLCFTVEQENNNFSFVTRYFEVTILTLHKLNALAFLVHVVYSEK